MFLEENTKNVPIDPKEDAARIFRAARLIAKNILARRFAMNAEGRADKPLLVFIGEVHNNAAHPLCQSAVLNQLAQTGLPLAVCLEYSFCNQDMRRSDHRAVLESFRENRLFAPVAHRAFLNRLVSVGLPVKMVDLPTDSYALMRARDKRVARAFQEAAFWDLSLVDYKAKALDVYWPEGMGARNAHMLKSALAFGQAQKASVIVQICGASHVQGVPAEKLFWASSLAGLSALQGHDYLGLNLSYRVRNSVPEAHRSVLRRIDLPERTFEGTRLSQDRQEKEYVRTVMPFLEELSARASRRERRAVVLGL